ncbi:hypothetical protein B0H63DRAFT_284476 [Podospora didyma]|uniref:Uncharacterized protein n=1 Tax=Podospora didyma TaxID=330526 RepID=A0AAE0N6I1_9PEZI|nr:hypothetical protein B0H63DRAFT_284476 [Podospora didyma]
MTRTTSQRSNGFVCLDPFFYFRMAWIFREVQSTIQRDIQSTNHAAREEAIAELAVLSIGLNELMNGMLDEHMLIQTWLCLAQIRGFSVVHCRHLVSGWLVALRSLVSQTCRDKARWWALICRDTNGLDRLRFPGWIMSLEAFEFRCSHKGGNMGPDQPSVLQAHAIPKAAPSGSQYGTYNRGPMSLGEPSRSSGLGALLNVNTVANTSRNRERRIGAGSFRLKLTEEGFDRLATVKEDVNRHVRMAGMPKYPLHSQSFAGPLAESCNQKD